LLNPAHPDFPNIAIGSAEQITTDGRLVRRSASSENAKEWDTILTATGAQRLKAQLRDSPHHARALTAAQAA
jgi:hypothetical protein